MQVEYPQPREHQARASAFDVFERHMQGTRQQPAETSRRRPQFTCEPDAFPYAARSSIRSDECVVLGREAHTEQQEQG
jgi:hypothetical protein